MARNSTKLIAYRFMTVSEYEAAKEILENDYSNVRIAPCKSGKVFIILIESVSASYDSFIESIMKKYNGDKVPVNL